MEPFDFIEEIDVINSTDDNFEKYNQNEVESSKIQLNINHTRLKIQSNNILKKVNYILNIYFNGYNSNSKDHIIYYNKL